MSIEYRVTLNRRCKAKWDRGSRTTRWRCNARRRRNGIYNNSCRCRRQEQRGDDRSRHHNRRRDHHAVSFKLVCKHSSNFTLIYGPAHFYSFRDIDCTIYLTLRVGSQISTPTFTLRRSARGGSGGRLISGPMDSISR